MAVSAPVPLPWRSPVSVVAPVPPLVTARALPRERVPRVAVCEKRLVEDAVVEKRFVVVAFASVVLPVTPNVPATARLPEESIVVVALPQKYAVPKLEKRVEDAEPKNFWSPVHVLEVVATSLPVLSVPRSAFVREVNHTVEVAVNCEVEALVKFWRAVQKLELPMLRAAVTAAVSLPEFAIVRPPAFARVAI